MVTSHARSIDTAALGSGVQVALSSALAERPSVTESKKFRYEFPRLEAHFVEAPSADAAFRYLQRKYPHNLPEVAASLVEIPHWPAFWHIVDADGRELPERVGRPLRR